MMDAPTDVTPEEIDELLAFLPGFEQPGRKFIRAWRGGDGTFPYPVYDEDVMAFFRLTGQGVWSDYQYEPRTAGEMLYSDAVIAAATIQQIKTMLTYCVRGERFSDGHWAHVLKTGRIQALLHRLAALRQELR